MTAPAPAPYNWRRLGRPGSSGLYNVYLTDKDGRNIATVWGRPDEKEATADLLAARTSWPRSKVLSGGTNPITRRRTPSSCFPESNCAARSRKREERTVGNMNWHRITQVGGAGLASAVIPVAFLTAPTAELMFAEVAAVALGIGSFIYAFLREERALEAEREAAAAEIERAWAYGAHVPEDAVPLHEEMRERVAAVREAVTRMAETARLMHSDRVAVHDRCEVLERENAGLVTQVTTANHARDLLASLPAPPLAPGQRPWPEPREETGNVVPIFEAEEELRSLIYSERRIGESRETFEARRRDDVTDERPPAA